MREIKTYTLNHVCVRCYDSQQRTYQHGYDTRLSGVPGRADRHSPAGSQEELQAAQTIADLMKRHDVDPEIEEFDARSLSKLGPAVLLALLFVGAFCLAIGSGAVTVIGLLLVAATMRPVLVPSAFHRP